MLPASARCLLACPPSFFGSLQQVISQGSSYTHYLVDLLVSFGHVLPLSGLKWLVCSCCLLVWAFPIPYSKTRRDQC